MNVSLNYYRPSMAIARIEQNLRAYLPAAHTWVDPEDADLLIFPVCGRRDHTLISSHDLLKQGRKYAVIQLSLKSTRNPDPKDWQEVWHNAEVVWSYYHLCGDFNFYHAPLGADPKLFYPLHTDRKYAVGMTGSYTRAECLWEVEKAARAAGMRALKIRAPTDKDLNVAYNSCRFISGLRRKEGFEMPAIEGFLSGARPLLFDTPDFRYWYDGIADFVPEGNPLAVVNCLESHFRDASSSVTAKEIGYARFRFNWERIINGFWVRCLL